MSCSTSTNWHSASAENSTRRHVAWRSWYGFCTKWNHGLATAMWTASAVSTVALMRSLMDIRWLKSSIRTGSPTRRRSLPLHVVLRPLAERPVPADPLHSGRQRAHKGGQCRGFLLVEFDHAPSGLRFEREGRLAAHGAEPAAGLSAVSRIRIRPRGDRFPREWPGRRDRNSRNRAGGNPRKPATHKRWFAQMSSGRLARPRLTQELCEVVIRVGSETHLRGANGSRGTEKSWGSASAPLW